MFLFILKKTQNIWANIIFMCAISPFFELHYLFFIQSYFCITVQYSIVRSKL
jgi:hypothetical protein